MNACVATGITPQDMSEGWDSVWIDFTKGLGTPIGAVLAGSAEFIDTAWRWKQRLGGAMRQAGIAAAACVYALDHHVERLGEDHANGSALAQGLKQIDGIIVQEPQTNLVFFQPSAALAASGMNAQMLVRRLRERGILLTMLGGRMRACTHLDVSSAMIEETLSQLRDIIRAA